MDDTKEALNLIHIQQLLCLSLTRAYVMEKKKSEWSGCVIDEKCVEYFDNKLKSYDTNTADLHFFEEMDIIRSYEVPMKSGPCKGYYAVNWTHFSGPRLTSTQVRKAFQSHNKSVTDWSVQNKITNTLKFLNDTKKGYKELAIKLTEKKNVT